MCRPGDITRRTRQTMAGTRPPGKVVKDMLVSFTVPLQRDNFVFNGEKLTAEEHISIIDAHSA